MGSNENETKVSVEGIKSDEVGISQREDELEIIEQPESAEVKLRCLNQLARKIYVMRVLNDFKKCQKIFLFIFRVSILIVKQVDIIKMILPRRDH